MPERFPVYADDCRTVLARDLVGSATVCTLEDATRFPQPNSSEYFNLTFRSRVDPSINEICRCINRVGNVLTLQRGQYATRALDWSQQLTSASLNATADDFIGKRGPKGDIGNPAFVNIRGTLPNAAALPATGTSGDGYVVGKQLYLWNPAQKTWVAAWAAIDAMAWRVAQLAHGFTVGQPVYLNPVDGKYYPAQADKPATLATGMVSLVFDADSFQMRLGGHIEAIPFAVTPGMYYYVSEALAGALQTTTPTIYDQPILYGLTGTTGLVLPLRASHVAAAGGGLADPLPPLDRYALRFEWDPVTNTSGWHDDRDSYRSVANISALLALPISSVKRGALVLVQSDNSIYYRNSGPTGANITGWTKVDAGGIKTVNNRVLIPPTGSVGDAYYTTAGDELWIWDAPAQDWTRVYQKNTILTDVSGLKSPLIPVVHFRWQVEQTRVTMADATPTVTVKMNPGVYTAGDVFSFHFGVDGGGMSVLMFVGPGENDTTLAPDMMFAAAFGSLAVITTQPDGTVVITPTAGHQITGAGTYAGNNVNPVLFRNAFMAGTGSAADIWIQSKPPTGQIITIQLNHGVTQNTIRYPVSAPDTPATIATAIAGLITATGDAAMTVQANTGGLGPGGIFISHTGVMSVGRVEMRAAPTTINRPPNPPGREGDWVTRWDRVQNESISVFDDFDNAWHKLFDRAEIQRAIAASSLFQSAVNEVGTGGAVAMTALPVLPNNTLTGHYWTWSGAAGYTIRAGDIPGDPWPGDVMQPGDWIQTNGTQYLHIPADLITKSRGDALYGWATWTAAPAYELDAIVVFNGVPYRANTGVSAGELSPDQNGKWTPIPITLGGGELLAWSTGTVPNLTPQRVRVSTPGFGAGLQAAIAAQSFPGGVYDPNWAQLAGDYVSRTSAQYAANSFSHPQIEGAGADSWYESPNYWAIHSVQAQGFWVFQRKTPPFTTHAFTQRYGEDSSDLTNLQNVGQIGNTYVLQTGTFIPFSLVADYNLQPAVQNFWDANTAFAATELNPAGHPSTTWSSPIPARVQRNPGDYVLVYLGQVIEDPDSNIVRGGVALRPGTKLVWNGAAWAIDFPIVGGNVRAGETLEMGSVGTQVNSVPDNALVTRLMPLITAQGLQAKPWIPNTRYTVGQIIQYRGTFFTVAATHTSSRYPYGNGPNGIPDALNADIAAGRMQTAAVPALSFLRDVNAAARAAGDALVYNFATGKWDARHLRMQELADLDANAQRIIGVAAPTTLTDAANKQYVDQIAAGLRHEEPVIDLLTTPPAGTFDAGDRYIVLPTGTGAWAGQDNQIATWDGAAWTFAPPGPSSTHFVEDRIETWNFNGTAWNKIAGVTPRAVSYQAAPPATAISGDLWINSTTQAASVYSGTAWQLFSRLPIIGGTRPVVALPGTLYFDAATKSTQVFSAAGGWEYVTPDLLADLGDVDVISATNLPNDGEALVYNGVTNYWEPAPLRTLATLPETDLTTPPNDGEALIFDGVSQTWKPTVFAAGGGGAIIVGAEPVLATRTAQTIWFDGARHWIWVPAATAWVEL